MSGRVRRTWKASWVCPCGHHRSRRARAAGRLRAAAVLNDSAVVQAVASNV